MSKSNDPTSAASVELNMPLVTTKRNAAAAAAAALVAEGEVEGGELRASLGQGGHTGVLRVEFL